MFCVYWDVYDNSVADPEGGAAAPPPFKVKKKTNNLPDFGQNMLRNASFKALDCKWRIMTYIKGGAQISKKPLHNKGGHALRKMCWKTI